jgi:hypothetical protein
MTIFFQLWEKLIKKNETQKRLNLATNIRVKQTLLPYYTKKHGES